MKKNAILVLLSLTTIFFGGLLVYEKYTKEENKSTTLKCKECPVCENNEENENDLNNISEYNTITGKYLSVTFNENQFTLVGISYNNDEEQLISSTKSLNDLKIKKAKITSFNSSDEEEVQLIMQDGSVYSAYFGIQNNGLYFTKNEILDNYKIEDIISVEVSSEGSTYKVLLQDGTTKVIDNN